MTPEFEAFVRNLPRDVFEPSAEPVAPSEFDRRLEVPRETFPDSYRAFVTTVGPGWWPNQSGIVITPAEAYAFDAECWEAEGLVALVENADGVGDRIAVNPGDPSIDGERPVYYVGHDPTSVVRAADSFEAWVRESVAPIGQGRFGIPRRYEHLDEARYASYARYRAWEKQQRRAARGPKRWWQFWR
jgi:SMI1 / KNR4 family (SUKH-1)